jgi:hypothetical protein
MKDLKRFYVSKKRTFQQTSSRFDMLSSWKKITILIVILGFGLFAWPTLYRYDKVAFGDRTKLTRTNRITGKSEILTSGGTWYSEKPQKDKSEITSLPQDEMLQINGNGSLPNGIEVFSVDMYNGSKWNISEITIKLTIYNIDNTIRWSRLFKSDISVEPLTSGSTSIAILDADNVGKFEWELNDVKGYLEKE